MNDWNKLVANRGAIAALEEVRAEVSSWFAAEPEERMRGDVIKAIDRMIADLK
jgi:hypothetical protein